MLVSRRVAWLAAPFLCLLGAATLSVPSFASETPEPTLTNATAMLAAVTGPLLIDDATTLASASTDFSSATSNSTTTPAVAAGSEPSAADAAASSPATAESLPDLVADHASAATSDDEANCLATTVYYESHGEPLAGQLAVAQTILNRTHSSRFPASVCGVVKQRGQFSFLRGGALPTPPQASSAWQTAVAIAEIARAGLYKQMAPEALYFHARRVSPGWGKTRVAALGQHIFFR